MDNKISSAVGRTDGLLVLLDGQVYEWTFVAKLCELYKRTHGGRDFEYGSVFTQDDFYVLFEEVTGASVDKEKSRYTDYIYCSFTGEYDPAILREIAPYLQGEIAWSIKNDTENRFFKGIFKDGIYKEVF